MEVVPSDAIDRLFIPDSQEDCGDDQEEVNAKDHAVSNVLMKSVCVDDENVCEREHECVRACHHETVTVDANDLQDICQIY